MVRPKLPISDYQRKQRHLQQMKEYRIKSRNDPERRNKLHIQKKQWALFNSEWLKLLKIVY
jgi:hypothetical protein